MRRMLIVDDERIERDGIRMLIQGICPEMEILEAPNGKKALQIIKERKIDFLMTDIKMPFMTGLELIKEVRDMDQEMQIAIFSGFGEFAYAKEAIRYGVTDYILKPVNPKEFKATVEQMILRTEEREREKEEKRNDNTFRKRYLFQRYILTGNENYVDLILKNDKERGEDDVSRIQNLMLLEGSETFFEDNRIEVAQGLEKKFGRRLDYLNLNANQILLIFYQSASDNYIRIAKDVQRYILENFNTECFIAVSHKIDGVKDCYKAYQEVELLLENKFYRTDTRVFLPGEEMEQDQTEYVRGEYQKRLQEDIRLKDFAHLWADYRTLQDIIYQRKMDSQMYVKFIFSEFVKEIYEEMDMVESPKLQKVIEDIYQSGSLNDICSYVEMVIREFEEQNEVSEEGARDDIEKVKKYISTHIEENLSIDRLAGQVYLSPGYLSYIFKKETGMNLSRYIKECRMEKAKALLKETNMKIVQVGKEVGFSNVSYFCQSFREYCGVSPEKYRKGETEYEEID